MRYVIVLICSLISAVSLKAQQTKVIEKKINNKTVKYRYEVLVDQPEIKHGHYELYYYNGRLKSKGKYVMGKKDGKWIEVYNNETVVEVQYFKDNKKVGIWEKHLENNQVVELFDQGQQKKLDPIIQNVRPKYPPLAREFEVEGLVEIRLTMNSDCSVSEITIIKDIGSECGKAAVKAVEQIAFLKKKYTIGQCNTKSEVLSFEFKLD